MSIYKRSFWLVLFFGFALIGVFWYFRKTPQVSKNLDDFAQCLQNKGVTMYGADWCSHCQNEKNRFGSSFKYISYIECPQNPQECLNIGIKGYPTWVFPDGRKLEGEQGLEKLSKESNCQFVVSFTRL